MKLKKVGAVLAKASLIFGTSKKEEKSDIESQGRIRNKAKHEKHIYISGISSVSISFRDADKYSLEQIINSTKAADRINKLVEK